MKADEVCSSYVNPAVKAQTRLGYNIVKHKWGQFIGWLVFSRLMHIRVVRVIIVIVAKKQKNTEYLVCRMFSYSLVALKHGIQILTASLTRHLTA